MTERPWRPRTRGAVPALTSIVVATGVIVALLVPAGPAGAVLAPQGASALDWIAAELEANSGTLPSSFDPDSTDWGLTVDAVLALAAGGRGGDAAPAAAEVTTNALSYVTGTDFASPDDRYAGPLAKLLLMVLVTGGDPASVPGIDPEVALRGRMGSDGPQAGRFSDASDFGDFSNGIGQALALLALERTGAGVPPEAVTFLLAQQCPAGGFRVSYDTGDSCTDDAEATVDATAFAAMALAPVPATPATTTALAEAGAWLASIQGPDGALGPGGNANSTGLGGAALRALGLVEASEAAAQALLALQLDSGPEQGAIAFDAATRASIAGEGVSDRDQLRRATTQGVLGLGLSPYGSIGRSGPFALSQPGPSATTVQPAPSTTAPGATAPGTTAAPAATTTTTTSVPTTTTTGAPQVLGLTGSQSSRLALIAATLVVAGGLAWLGGRSPRWPRRQPM